MTDLQWLSLHFFSDDITLTVYQLLNILTLIRMASKRDDIIDIDRLVCHQEILPQQLNDWLPYLP